MRKQLEFFSDANSELKAKLHDSQSTSKKTAEILKYGQFITKKIREIPKWEEFFSDRTSQSTFISQIKSQKFDEVLLKTLQFTSDIIVHSLKSERSSIDLLSFCNESEKNFKSEESENLLLTINAQSERIAKLNRQISEAMISSKELLYSPLAPVVRGNSRNSRSICYSSSNEFNPKNYFSTPDRWRLEKNVIAEQNVDEETSGKPLG